MICARVKKKGSKVGLIYSYINKIILYNNVLPAEDGIMVYVPSETEIEMKGVHSAHHRCEEVVVDIFLAAADGCQCFVSTAGAGAGLIPAICAKSQPVCWNPRAVTTAAW